MNALARKIGSMLTAITIIYTGTAAVVSATPATFTMKIDGRSAPVHYIIQDGKMLVPAVYFRKLGVQVHWNDSQQAVILVGKNQRLALPAGKNKAYTSVGTSERWTEKTIDATTVNYRGNTYIPLRYAAQTLGISLTYQGAASTISLRSLGESTAQPADREALYWLYQITEAEAGGESYKGKTAVAATILNRVESTEWPNTIKDVIFDVDVIGGVQYYQFSPVLDGRIYKVTPSKETIRAVNDAFDGVDPTNGATVFYNPEKTNNQWVRSRPVSTTIGNHIFAY